MQMQSTVPVKPVRVEEIDAATAVVSSLSRLLDECNAQVLTNNALLGRTEQQPISQQPAPQPHPARTAEEWMGLMKPVLVRALKGDKRMAAHEINSVLLRAHPLRAPEFEQGLMLIDLAKKKLVREGFLIRKKVKGGTFLYQLAE